MATQRRRRAMAGGTAPSGPHGGEGFRVAEELTERAEEAMEELEDRLHIPHSAAKTAEPPSMGDATISYFAYGSNMSSKVLTGRRNVRPAESTPAVLPDYKLVFHQPGLPYTEPGFASVEPCSSSSSGADGSAPALAARPDVHGVLHRVTPDEWRFILMTEGASDASASSSDGSDGDGKQQKQEPEGGGYMVIEVEVETYDGRKVKAHTLTTSRATLARLRGRDALPSKRYLTIIRDGAAESGLDEGYCRWLATLDHYEARTLGQKLGRLLFAGVTFMLLSPSFVLLRLYRKWRGVENGSPPWLQAMFRFIFRTVWVLHEALRPLLGCGATNVATRTKA